VALSHGAWPNGRHHAQEFAHRLHLLHAESSIENITTGALIGTEASDHNPLVATFAVK